MEIATLMTVLMSKQADPLDLALFCLGIHKISVSYMVP